jgi:ABC-type proline/glycine betaine transport system permease subunit
MGTETMRTAVSVRTARDQYELRLFPMEDVFFYCKKIDNSRLVREADPKAHGACWSAIGAAAAIVALLTGALVPSVANTLAGYKLEALRAEERKLIDERRALDLEEARLLSPDRLEKLAQKHNLVTPANGQVYHLDGKSDGAVAMVK